MTVLLQWKTLPVGIYVDVTLLHTTHLNTVANQHPLLHKLWLPHKVPHQTTKTARKQLNSSVLCFLSLSSNSDLNLITEVCNPHDLRDQMSQFQKCCETKRIFFLFMSQQIMFLAPQSISVQYKMDLIFWFRPSLFNFKILDVYISVVCTVHLLLGYHQKCLFLVVYRLCYK